MARVPSPVPECPVTLWNNGLGKDLSMKAALKRLPPGIYFWILVAVVALSLVAGFIHALFDKGDTRQMLGLETPTNNPAAKQR